MLLFPVLREPFLLILSALLTKLEDIDLNTVWLNLERIFDLQGSYYHLPEILEEFLAKEIKKEFHSLLRFENGHFLYSQIQILIPLEGLL